MAAFVLSVYGYVYLRIRGPPGAGKKKAINRKEEYEEKEEYEAILGAGNEEGLKQKEEYEGKEEYEKKIMQQVLSTKEVRQQTIYFL